MNSEFFNRYHSKNTLCRFRHRFVFWVSNLYEIVSIEVVNFHSGFQQPVERDGYFWGKYELLVYYRRNNNEAEIRQKRFTRGFFFPVPFYLSALGDREHGEAAGYLKNCACEAEFSHQIAPLLLMFFPLFSRLKYVPFKAVIYVYGMISEAAEGESIEQNKCCGEGCSCLHEEESSQSEFEVITETEIIGEDWTETKDEESPPPDETADALDLELIALDRKKTPESPDNGPGQSHTYRLFYNMIMEHQESIHNTEGNGKQK